MDERGIIEAIAALWERRADSKEQLTRDNRCHISAIYR